jgi:hypothetical protein
VGCLLVVVLAGLDLFARPNDAVALFHLPADDLDVCRVHTRDQKCLPSPGSLSMRASNRQRSPAERIRVGERFCITVQVSLAVGPLCRR